MLRETKRKNRYTELNRGRQTRFVDITVQLQGEKDIEKANNGINVGKKKKAFKCLTTATFLGVQRNNRLCYIINLYVLMQAALDQLFHSQS